MSKTLIRNALLVPVDDEKPDFFFGDIMINGDLIEAIAEHPQELQEEDADRVIIGDQLIIMPGFVNTHGHAAMTLFRSFADDMPLKDWLEQKIWPVEEHLTGDDVYWGTMLALAEMIRGGTTTFTDMYFFMDRVAEASAESGIRAVLSRGLIGTGSGSEKGLTETESFADNWHGAENGRINVMLGPHAPYTCPTGFLKKVMALAAKTDLPIQIHLSETAGEVEDSLKEHGFTPPRVLDNLGFFDYPVIAAHCVYLNSDDLAILAEKNVKVAHNPGSNLKLGSGIAPVVNMLQHGIIVGLGTDGASSNNNLDMIEEMRLAALIAKGVTLNPVNINAGTALKMATTMGAEALSLVKTGSLKAGWKSDLIGLRYDRPHLTPMHDPVAQLVYAAAAADVDLVMVDGRLLYEGGEYKTLDIDKIRAEAELCAKRLVKT